MEVICRRFGSFALALLVALSTLWLMPSIATAVDTDGIKSVKCKYGDGQTQAETPQPTATSESEGNPVDPRVTETVSETQGTVIREEASDARQMDDRIRIVLIAKKDGRVVDVTNFGEAEWPEFEKVFEHKEIFTVFAAQEDTERINELKSFFANRGCDKFKDVNESKDVKKSDEEKAIRFLKTENLVAFCFRYINAEQRRRNVENSKKLGNIAKGLASFFLF